MSELLWTGRPPASCDLCESPISTVFYDAQTRQRIWACLCEPCFAENGIGLGKGTGQKYERRENGLFVKVRS